ncbi:putative tail tubular protein A (endogenous virus) [Gutovirus Vc1]|uniref:Putative tail tubular protein A n=1 Tax=Vibrio phage Vc1 TaxID=1480731 RepID=X2L0B3_9CAUD|nr:putative tail tubular protein A [Vibrio phage Vc1]AHN84659.1 putative tail tubular protein A [Vibrio phage Vc1]
MDINLNLGINTKVDAINRVLEAIGSVGINSEEEIDWNIDAASADKLIDAMSQQIQINQGKGWWFNREAFHKFTPDKISGYVVVPSNTISATVKRQDNGGVLPVTLRGNTLFDTKSVGYDMRKMVNRAGVIECVLVMNLPFEYLPASAKHAITDACRFWMVNDMEGDSIKMQSLQRAADASYVALQSADASQSRRNMFHNKDIRRDTRLVGGFNNV